MVISSPHSNRKCTKKIVAQRILSWTLIGHPRTFWRFSSLHREGTVENCRMTRRCRFDVLNARCGLQSLLNVNRVVHTRWWHTWKVMAIPPEGGSTPILDGRLWAPKCEILTVPRHLDMPIGCASNT